MVLLRYRARRSDHAQGDLRNCKPQEAPQGLDALSDHRDHPAADPRSPVRASRSAQLRGDPYKEYPRSRGTQL